MNTVAIAGVGLIGGSFGLALRKAGFTGRILGVSSPGTIEQAIRRGAIDQGATLEQSLESADLFYLAQPISVILETISRIGPLVSRGILFTDAGSTKRTIVKQAAKYLPPGSFLGGHPVAGKEARGVDAADPDLFSNQYYILTPDSDAQLDTPPVRELVSWLQKIGALVRVMSPASHDRALAFTSHLPQLASTALASVISSEFSENDATPPAGPGLQDMTRLAQSPWEIWRDILGTNTVEVRHALEVYIDKLSKIRDNLTSSTLVRDFTSAAEAAGRLRDRHKPGSANEARHGNLTENES